MGFDSPDTNARTTPRKTKDGLHFYPVSPGESGEGLPYAPEDWPNPGDKWRWKAGKRVIGSGYFRDRFLYLPSRLVKDGQPKYFRSKYSVEQYVQSAFPGTDVNTFFASFRWNIPLKQTNLEELLGADSHLAHTCKAGNKMCISLSGVSDPPLSETMFCDICCSEPDFCRNCCCILCSKTISSAFGNYGYIKCKAILVDGCICGHIAHVDCALRAHVIGSYDLDAEYFCRRCDSRTDLVSHVIELLQICESINSRDEIETILNSAISILHGSRKSDARQLLHHIESVMTKLKNGANFEDMWKKEEALLEVITAQPKVTKKKRTTHGKPRKDNAKGKRQKRVTEDEVELQRDIQLSFSSDSVFRNDEEDVVVHGNSNGEESATVHGNSNDEEAVTVHGNSNHEEVVLVHGNSNDELQQLIRHENSNDEEEDVVHGKSNDDEAVVAHGNSVVLEELKRVKAWRSWRLMPIGELSKMTNENIDVMVNEEHFALRWLNTNDISQALILNYINEASELKKTEIGKENRRLKTGIELSKEELVKKHTLEVDALEKKIEQTKAHLTALSKWVGNLNSTMSTNVVPTLNSLVVGQLEAFDLLKSIHDNLDDAKKGKSEAEKISER